MNHPMTPAGVLLDYGGTLVREAAIDVRAGNDWLWAQATYRPAHVTLDDVLNRAARVTLEVSGRRDGCHMEAPWPGLARLIHDYLGIRFDQPFDELELGFWKAAVRTEEMPGARDALARLHGLGIPLAVVSNTAFGEQVIRYELARYGLAEYLRFVMVSSAYNVRKPDVLFLETAAARLGIDARDIWFVGDRLDKDVAGAKAAGMTAVWLRPAKVALPATHNADLVVDDWDALITALTAQRQTPSPARTAS
jgi:putative hydrolase of the HAD superfamily